MVAGGIAIALLSRRGWLGSLARGAAPVSIAVAALAFAAGGTVTPVVAAAQQSGAVAEAPDDGRSFSVLGRSPERRRAIPGMWAMHPFEPQFPEVDYTSGFGAQFSTFFVATFVNSYNQRSFVAGIERNWLEISAGLLSFGGGYRLGVVTGYDERLFGLAGKTPLLPFVGALGWVQVGPIGVDLFYVYRAITLETSVGL